MATHHQPSPAGALTAHHVPPAGPSALQANGHASAQFQGQQPQSSLDYLNSMNAQIWYHVGHLADTIGNNEIAVQSYNRALHFDTRHVPSLQALANILRAEDKYSEAVSYIKVILGVDQSNGESWAALGHCYLMMDELQQAYTAYQSALYNLGDPKEPKLWYGIGILYDRYGSLDHAEEAFSQVMRMAPEFEKANEIYFRLGIIYKQQAKYRESLECFRYIVNTPPNPLNQQDIWFQIGHVYEQQKDYENAKNAYVRVLDRDPRHAKVLQQLGWLHHQQSNDYASQEQAIEYLEKSVSSDGNDAQSWYLLGRCYMSQHKFPKAYEAYQQAVYRDGRNPTFWCSIGVLYYQINQYRDALDAYSRAIRLNPNISEVWYDLGTLYESCNNQTSDALDAYQRAAELDPQNQHIKTRLELLRKNQTSGHPNGAPQPQDMPVSNFQPAVGMQPQWGSQAPHAPAPPHQQQPQQSQQQAGPPPPPPMNASRDWNQSQHHSGMHDQHRHHPQIPPPQQQAHPYDQARDVNRGYIPPRQPSPRSEHMRHDPHRHASMHNRQPSPSPRMRNTHPSNPNYRPPPVQLAPPVPQSAIPPAIPNPMPIPSNRISNPNFVAQPPPPAPGPQQAPPHNHGPLPPYGRPSSPTLQVRPIIDGKPPSPGSGYVHHSNERPYQHHPDPNNPGIAAGAPLSGAALAAAEAATAREREDRPSQQPQPPKRLRDRDDRDDEIVRKKNANGETRAQLDDPHMRRNSPPMPMTPSARERDERMRIGGPTSATGSGPQSHVSSPMSERRVEEVRRANENYKPSEAAHHPQPLSTVLHQESASMMHHQSPKEHSRREESASHQLPPINVRTANNGARASAGPSSAGLSSAERRELDGDRMDMDQKREDTASMAQSMPLKRPEEPAARKIEVDENYDDEEPEYAGNEKQTDAAHAGQKSIEGRNHSPSSSKLQNGMMNSSNSADAIQDRPKIEAI